ncbi:MAG: hypothetical protein WC249_01395 [Patescibacteria group bacterium]|jgi:hypothetical protein
MNIVINTTGINNFLNLPPNQMFWVFLGNGGWLFLAVIFLYGARLVYLSYIQQKWAETHKNILLAIDIPRGNEQSPKAVENMFTYLAGAHGSISFFEKWFEGKFQKSFSFEIVSLEGYTQFLIRTPVEFTNLVESAVYSQYPDAEISEVDDYVGAVPSSVPDDEYDVWGTEFIQSLSFVYPIKCYQEFEHQMGPSETQFKDPMASLMDLFGSLRQGEHLWFQMILIPTGFTWIKDSIKEINKIFGRKEKTKPGLVDKLIEGIGNASELIYSIWGDIESGAKKEVKPKTMMDLTPDEKRKVESIQLKASKLAFEAKFRIVYVAKHEVMNKAKVVSGIVGYMKQFASLDLNNLRPDMDMTFVKAIYFFTKSRLLTRKRKIFGAYIGRSGWRGRLPGLYNIEELATVWHFPLEANVKAAMMQKAPGRKADAPASLPLAEETVVPLPDIFKQPLMSSRRNIAAETTKENKTSNKEDILIDKNVDPPANLPFV